MQNCLGELNLTYALIYLDDVIVYSRTEEEHLTRLRAVFERFLESGLKLKPSKCHFLGGLSLHLNHLIGSRVTNYDWPFGTLLFRLFGSNLDTRDLETYPRTYSGHV